MREKGLDDYVHVCLNGWSTLDGMEAGEELIQAQSQSLPSAIMVGNDPIAVGVYRALKKNNIRIPEDVSIVSFDNIEVAEYLTPSLSTVSIHTEEIGKLAVNLAKEMLTEDKKIPVHVIVSYEMIARESEKEVRSL